MLLLLVTAAEAPPVDTGGLTLVLAPAVIRGSGGFGDGGFGDGGFGEGSGLVLTTARPGPTYPSSTLFPGASTFPSSAALLTLTPAVIRE